MNDGDLRPEIRLLLALAETELSPERQDECRAILVDRRNEIDFGFFVDQAARHGVLPLVGRNIVRYRLAADTGGATLVPYPWLYASAYQSNRTRNAALADEFGKVLRALNAAGLRYAIRKGPVLTEHVYRDLGARRMGDIDILARRADTEQFAAVLDANGYQQGWLDESGTKVRPFTRKTQVYWRVNLNNQLPFVKVGHRDEVEQFAIDICTSLFQPRSGGQAPVDELLDRSVPLWLCGVSAWSLSPDDQLMDLCVHLHKEATSLFYINVSADLQLKKFYDVALTCRLMTERNEWPSFTDRVVECNAAEPVYYALYFTNLLYPEHVPAEILARLRPADVDYLDEYGDGDGKRQAWKTPFITRMFDPARGHEVAATTSIPVE